MTIAESNSGASANSDHCGSTGSDLAQPSGFGPGAIYRACSIGGFRVSFMLKMKDLADALFALSNKDQSGENEAWISPVDALGPEGGCQRAGVARF